MTKMLMPLLRVLLLHAVLVLVFANPALGFHTAAPAARVCSQVQRGPHPTWIPSNSCSSNKKRSTVLIQSYNDEELPKFSSDIVPNDDDKSSSDKKKKKDSGKLVERLDDYGQSLKPKAQEVNLRSSHAVKRKSKIGLKLKSCLYYTMYMFYRGYRGFFVILPAVFREVYRKMETAVDFRVLDDDEDAGNNKDGTTGYTAGDINPATGKIRWRTKITVSVLAGIVTMTYVVGGLARVLMKFIKTILSTSSLSGSFSAAADEVEGNEGRLMRLSKKNPNDSKNVNGRRGGSSDIGF